MKSSAKSYISKFTALVFLFENLLCGNELDMSMAAIEIPG